MDSRTDSSETLRNKCAACYRQFNKMEHLVEHMKVSFHSPHEPTCGVCMKHCRSFESLREHLIGPLPKAECARVFSIRGCNLCLDIFSSPSSLLRHRGSCQFSRTPAGIVARMSRLGLHGSSTYMDFTSTRGARVVALSCKMVGGGSDGTLDMCGRVCLVDEHENVIFHAYVKPKIPITNFRYESTGMRAEHIRDAMPLKQVQRRIQDFLCNGEGIWKMRSTGGKARILVGHGLDGDLHLLGFDYPPILLRDIAKYPPLMKTSKLSNPLKYLAQAYLGYDIQTGVQDPYEDCVAAMRLYLRMSSRRHHRPTAGEARQNHSGFPSSMQKDLAKMSPSALLEMSTSDYYCWCLDS